MADRRRNGDQMNGQGYHVRRDPEQTEAGAPMVSVAVTTFNHEAYIRQALDSILMQSTTFAVEVVVGEDCSTDGTWEVVSKIAAKHPERVRAKHHAVNLGIVGNTVDTYRRCRGRYIAVLEGDDYWNDPLKLQKQVDYMEGHPDVSICGHAADELWGADGRAELHERPAEFSGVACYGLEEVLWQGRPVHTATLLFRSAYRDQAVNFIELFRDHSDTPLMVFGAMQGLFAVSSERMAVHRLNFKGAWSGKLGTVVNSEVTIDYWQTLRGLLPQHARVIDYHLAVNGLRLATGHLLWYGDGRSAARIMWGVITNYPRCLLDSWDVAAKLIVRLPFWFLYPRRPR
jgi:glycosyltransferase involved in cell wall biosynthesis